MFGPTDCHIQIRLDWETIRKLGLELTIEEIRRAIINSKKLKLKARVVLLIDSTYNRKYIFAVTRSSRSVCQTTSTKVIYGPPSNGTRVNCPISLSKYYPDTIELKIGCSYDLTCYHQWTWQRTRPLSIACWRIRASWGYEYRGYSRSTNNDKSRCWHASLPRDRSSP